MTTNNQDLICFRFTGDEDSKKCIEWINNNTQQGQRNRYVGQLKTAYTNKGAAFHIVNDPLLISHRLVTPAEFLRIVREPQWKVGDECDITDSSINNTERGIIVSLTDNYAWVKADKQEYPITKLKRTLRPVRKSVREEIEEVIRQVFDGISSHEASSRIIELIKQRKDEL